MSKRRSEKSLRAEIILHKLFNEIKNGYIKQVDVVKLTGMSSSWVSENYLKIKGYMEYRT